MKLFALGWRCSTSHSRPARDVFSQFEKISRRHPQSGTNLGFFRALQVP